jgi:hypothetical protein
MLPLIPSAPDTARHSPRRRQRLRTGRSTARHTNGRRCRAVTRPGPGHGPVRQRSRLAESSVLSPRSFPPSTDSLVRPVPPHRSTASAPGEFDWPASPAFPRIAIKARDGIAGGRGARRPVRADALSVDAGGTGRAILVAGSAERAALIVLQVVHPNARVSPTTVRAHVSPTTARGAAAGIAASRRGACAAAGWRLALPIHAFLILAARYARGTVLPADVSGLIRQCNAAIAIAAARVAVGSAI